MAGFRLLVTALAVLSIPISALGNEYRAIVVSVLDGDTVRVRFVGPKPPPNPESRGRPRPDIRLRFSDSPETRKKYRRKPGQPFGDAATNFAKSLLPVGSEIRLITDNVRERGFYNRPLGIVMSGPHNVNLAVIAAGLAHTYPYPSPDKAITCKSYRLYIPYVDAEVVARRLRKGMWRENGLMETPRNYRRRTGNRQPSKLTLPEYSDSVIKRIREMGISCGK
jgi:endonuclease YncB( thermonuclease family)